jgi:hypothetical protein
VLPVSLALPTTRVSNALIDDSSTGPWAAEEALAADDPWLGLEGFLVRMLALFRRRGYITKYT